MDAVIPKQKGKKVNMSGAQVARESEEANSERGQGKDTTFYYK